MNNIESPGSTHDSHLDHPKSPLYVAASVLAADPLTAGEVVPPLLELPVRDPAPRQRLVPGVAPLARVQACLVHVVQRHLPTALHAVEAHNPARSLDHRRWPKRPLPVLSERDAGGGHGTAGVGTGCGRGCRCSARLAALAARGRRRHR